MRSRNESRLDGVRIYTMRDLNQRTAEVVREVLDAREPALITKHGRFLLMLSPVADTVESAIVGAVLGEGVHREQALGHRSTADAISTEDAANALGVTLPPGGYREREIEQ